MQWIFFCVLLLFLWCSILFSIPSMLLSFKLLFWELSLNYFFFKKHVKMWIFSEKSKCLPQILLLFLLGWQVILVSILAWRSSLTVYIRIFRYLWRKLHYDPLRWILLCYMFNFPFFLFYAVTSVEESKDFFF